MITLTIPACLNDCLCIGLRFSAGWLLSSSFQPTIFLMRGRPRHFSSRPFSFVIRKLAHWSEYFILAVLLMRALNARSAGLIAKRHMLWSVIWAVIYGVIDEWHQSFVLSRQARVADVIIDSVGAACGTLAWYWRKSGKGE
jgi:VanZ family protein